MASPGKAKNIGSGGGGGSDGKAPGHPSSPDPPHPAPPKSPRRSIEPGTAGVMLGLAAPVLWSSSGMFIKILPLQPIPLAGLRAALAALAFLPLQRPFRLRPEGDLIILAISYCVMNLTFVMATKWTTAANAIALQSAAPIWIFLVSCLTARRMLWRSAPPLALVAAGLTVILFEPAVGSSLLGNLLGVVSGVAFAATAIFYSRVRRPAAEVMFLINAFTALTLFLVRPDAFHPAQIGWEDWLSLAYLGAIQTGLGHYCYYGALQRITPSQASILALLEPLLNPIWVYLAVSEIPSPHGFTGAGLVLLGIAADSWQRLRTERNRW